MVEDTEDGNLDVDVEANKRTSGDLQKLGMGANRTRIRELADSQPILLIRTNSQGPICELAN